ncbi:MAG TPA: hypothetical protein VEY12_12085 [Thermoplasmata archaeon]|nr:hypothetical protein [Thermoplasmata archaeon]
MIAYSMAVGVGLVIDAWLLALVLLRSHRPWLQATFAALVLTYIVNGAAFIGTAEGFLPVAWEPVVLWTFVLTHPLTAILVLTLIHGETVPRRRPAAFALLALVPLVVLLTPSADWAVQHAYEPNVLGAFLIVCLGVALAEPVYMRLTSLLYAADSFWLTAAVAALIVGGPIYALEFPDLGIAASSGSNVAAPVAVALFAFVLFHTEPYEVPHLPRQRSPAVRNELAPGTAVVFDEARPKYAAHVARAAHQAGASALVIARLAAISDYGTPSDFAALQPTRYGASRTLGTASEFWARSPGGTAVLLDTADVVMMSSWPWAEEAVLRMAGVARGTRSRLVISASRLTSQEKEALRGHRLGWWVLPDPAEEMQAVLAQSFGPGARQLLEAFARGRGTRREDLTLSDTEPFLQFLDRAVSELGSPAADDAARSGLRAQTSSAATALRAFAARLPDEVSTGDWPSRQSTEIDRGILVTAADYWKGKEMDELFAVASDLGDRGSLFERTRAVFVDQLGDAGEGILRSELAKLGKRAEDLRPEDVARLADRAAVDLVALAEVVDVPQERERIQGQVESIRRRLEALAGETR